ncbi:MAG: hypothetical protein JO140_04740 [Candidatus Eremiobacteraeota bacterium]|nr:hypothetical protein [Candidatus Eremiobacteraeota bacterium]
MGLPQQALVPFFKDHADEAFAGPVLLFGNPAMSIGPDRVVAFLRAHGVEPVAGAIPQLAEMDPSLAIQARTFFELLGLPDVHILDIDAYQQADIIADLNQPVPENLHGRFRTIVDAGTLEHILDVRTCLSNIVKMLAVGGRIVHQSPVNNYVNHGFFQISPTLFFDYYGANGFDAMHGVFVAQPVQQAMTTPWNFLAYEDRFFSGLNSVVCGEETQLSLHFHAKKGRESAGEVLPIQNYFRRVFENDLEWISNQRHYVMGHSAGGLQLKEFEVK